MRIAFVGCGAAGRPLGYALRRAGHEIGAVLARTTAAEAAAAMGGGNPGGSLDDAEVVIFATPDDVLAAAARAHPLRPDQTALHLSGFHPSTILAPTGAATASLHPLRAFADLETAVAALPRTTFFVEGAAVSLAEGLVRDIGAVCTRIATEKKALYHAAAAIASNCTVGLLSWARDLFVRAGVDGDLALPALVELARGSLDNLDAVGLPRGLTGPVSRGDVEVVKRHLEALPEEERALYRALVALLVPIAAAKGGVDAEAERALRELASD